MDGFKLQMNWNQEELEQWALAARQKEEDNLALLKYTKADEAKMKDLSLQLEKMLAAVQKKRAELEDEVTETQAAQIELDKTAEDFRSLHRERGELVTQWENAVQAMQKRDEAIKRARERIASGCGTEADADAVHEDKNNGDDEDEDRVDGSDASVGSEDAGDEEGVVSDEAADDAVAAE